MILVRESAPFTRTERARHLDSRGIGNRSLFGGNLVRQPAFQDLGRSRPGPFRCVGPLPGADALKNHAIFVGVYPGLGEEQIDHIAAEIARFVRSAR